jgi:hypothetical protein
MKKPEEEKKSTAKPKLTETKTDKKIETKVPITKLNTKATLLEKKPVDP